MTEQPEDMCPLCDTYPVGEHPDGVCPPLEQPRTKVEHFRSAVETVLGEVLPETAERILRAFEKALREAEEQAFAKGYAEAATRMLFDVLERERQSEDRPIPRYCEGCAKGGEHGKDHS